MKHTPGPWVIHPYNPHVVKILAAGQEHLPVAQTTGDEREGMDPLANARLISAAPELLDCALALREFLRMFETAAFESIQDEPGFFKLVSHIRTAKALSDSAIAKARGES